MLMNNSPFGNYWTKKFTDFYSTVDLFKEDYKSNGLPVKLNDTSIETLYYLLYARYGNSHIMNFDETQFKYKLFSIIFMYGPTWEKRLEIQDNLRNLTEDEIREGTSTINNFAQATGSSSTNTKTTKNLNGVNNQSRTMYEKDKLSAYNNLIGLLETDVTKEFIDKFKQLFLLVARPQEPLYYISEED